MRALPKIKEFARNNFRERNHAPWFKWKDYCDLCAAVGHEPDDEEPMFLVAQDCDSRHSMKYFWAAIDAKNDKKKQDQPDSDEDEEEVPCPYRWDIPAYEPGHIPIDKHKNYLPTAPKVPDAVQFPIESCFAPVKRRFRALAHAGQCSTPAEMMAAIERAFEECATVHNIRRCFEHGADNMQIFMGTEQQTVLINHTVHHCTHGGPLPKRRRG